MRVCTRRWTKRGSASRFSRGGWWRARRRSGGISRRELHDEIGQLLTGLKLTLEAEADSASPKSGKATAGHAQALVHDLMERVRGLSLDLRPAMLDDLGLVSALVWNLDRYTAQTRIKVRLEQNLPSERFASGIETAAYRIVQEALTNVARHAGVGGGDRAAVDNGRPAVRAGAGRRAWVLTRRRPARAGPQAVWWACGSARRYSEVS